MLKCQYNWKILKLENVEIERVTYVSKKQLIRGGVLNGVIVVVNVLLLSGGFFNLLGQESIVLKAIGIAVIVMSILFFLYGNYCIFVKDKPIKLYKSEELKTPDDYIDALEEIEHQKVFRSQINTCIKQVEGMKKKSQLLETVLLQYFTPGEMTYGRFQNVIDETATIFFDHVKRFTNRVAIYDPDFEQSGGISSKEITSYLEDTLRKNNFLLKKLDDLILEVSKLDDIDVDSFEELPAIHEIDRLIEETKYYN